MKKFKIIFCALLILCGGAVFSACKEETKLEFDTNRIYVEPNYVYMYDGMPHAFDVEYEGMDVEVTYALDTNKNNFKPLSQLETFNAGTYNLYYRISANGYNSYVSPETFEVTVQPRTFQVFADDYVWFKGYGDFVYNGGYITSGRINDDEIGLEFVCPGLDVENAEYGSQYDLACTITNPNYVVEVEPATVTVGDYLQINKSNGDVRTFTNNIHDAIELAESGDVIVLNKSIEINHSVVVDKSITIDGQNRYSIFTNRTFDGYGEDNEEVKTMFMVKDANVNLTLKDVKLNGNKTARCVSAFTGKVVVDGATITNGKKTDKWRSGGVYITNSASFEMTSGSITGNFAKDTDYTQYCADLWIGANANGSMASVTGGTIGNVFVNSNSYSATGAGKFVLDGGNITNVFVEYDSGYGAHFEYKTGEVEHLKIALKNDNNQYYGEYYELTPVENTSYFGGKLVYAKTETTISDETYSNNIDSLLVDGENYIFENCAFNAPISTTKKVGLVFNNCTFTTSTASTNLYVTSVSELVVANCTFNGTVTDGYAIDVNLYSATCDNLLIVNNIFNTTTEDGATIAIKSRLGSTDYPNEAWILGQTEGKFNCKVAILGNDFTASNNIIELGTTPQGMSTAANKSTGNFDIIVSGNADALTIFKKFNDSASVQPPYNSKVNVKVNETYDSTK